MLNFHDQMCQSCKIKVKKTFVITHLLMLKPTLLVCMFSILTVDTTMLHYSSFVLQSVHVGYILYYSYCVMFQSLCSHYELGDLPSPLLYSILPFESNLVFSHRNSFHNEKAVMIWACVAHGAL